MIRRYVEHVMGMPISLALRGRHADDDRARAAWDEVVASLRDADRVFSTYRADSYVSRIARGELDVTDCPPEVAEVIALGNAAEERSNGAFSLHRPAPNHAAVGPASGGPGAGGFGGGGLGGSGLGCGSAGGAFGSVGTTFDPTGVVKGWAVERAAEALRRLPATDFCLSAGGDLVCRTLDPDAPPWRIGIEDPHDTARVIAVVPVFTGAVATSGTARRGAHLVDARTGRAPVGVGSVTVVADSLTWADIDATAAYAHGPDAAEWLRRQPGRSGLVVWVDGSTTVV